VNLHSKRTKLAALIFSTGVFLALMGCASVTGPVSYPTSWAPIESVLTEDGCPALEGTYSDRGAEAFPTELGEPPRLSEVFVRMGRGTGLFSPRESKRVWPVLPDSVSVGIVQTPEMLKFTFLGRNREQTSLDFRRYHFKWSEKRFDDLFTCYSSNKEARLRFFAEPESSSTIIPNLYLGGSGTLVFLLKATDGSLIVQWRSESAGISAVLLGTHISFNSVWWRYPPLSDSR